MLTIQLRPAAALIWISLCTTSLALTGAEPNLSEFAISPEDRQYWAFQPIQRPSVPDDALSARSGAKAIDQFIAARWESRGLTPNPDTDAATLCRRAHFDLIGLPPSYDEIQAFTADSRPDA